MNMGSGFWRHRARRRFGRGMLKYVVLKLLAAQPSHGYDVMRLFGEHGWGNLAAGTLYPTLAKLEELGYVEGREEGGKRTYRVTEAGRQRLREIGEELEMEFEAHASAEQPRSDMRDALARLSTAVSQAAGSAKPETAAQIIQKLDSARKEIYMLLANE